MVPALRSLHTDKGDLHVQSMTQGTCGCLGSCCGRGPTEFWEEPQQVSQRSSSFQRVQPSKNSCPLVHRVLQGKVSLVPPLLCLPTGAGLIPEARNPTAPAHFVLGHVKPTTKPFYPLNQGTDYKEQCVGRVSNEKQQSPVHPSLLLPSLEAFESLMCHFWYLLLYF